MKKLFLSLFFLCFLWADVYAQLPALERIEPMFWWAGMRNPKLQLLVHGKNIGQKEVVLQYSGVSLEKVGKVENPNYLFLNLIIDPSAKPGKFPILFRQKGQKDLSYSYELKTRNNGRKAQGVTGKDFIYLIMPDRFANGDPKNDRIKGMNDQSLNRDSIFQRHGGDLQGIIDHLDYLQELGITTLWLNPVLENDEPSASYHGYANTENYKVDRRLGSNESYKKLVDLCHQKGMKVIQDLVHNHIGDKHFTWLDMPMKNWVHQWPKYTQTTYRDQTVMDPHASFADKKRMQDGWFDRHMPDMDQQNPYVQNYITQSHIWWIEYAGVDGFRLDTYAYNDPQYMADWGKKVKTEYPQLSVFGETWVSSEANQAYFTQGNTVNRGLDTELPGVTDFQLKDAIYDALNGKLGWTDGVNKLYTVLSRDFLYQDASRNNIFLDNHDISRFVSVVNEDMTKYKSGIALLMTLRGIPQLYYGTEVWMKNFANPDGLVRLDFKGGWKGDKENKFSESGRNAKENEAFDYVKKLANYRKTASALQTGKLMQFVPEDGVYVFFRYDSLNTIMVMYNGNEKAQDVKLERFSERLNGFKTATEIISRKKLNKLDSVNLPAKTAWIFELGK